MSRSVCLFSLRSAIWILSTDVHGNGKLTLLHRSGPIRPPRQLADVGPISLSRCNMATTNGSPANSVVFFDVILGGELERRLDCLMESLMGTLRL